MKLIDGRCSPCFVREICTDEPEMRRARKETTKEEKNPTGVRKRESRRYEDRVFPLIEERNSIGISLTNPAIREEGIS